MREFDKNRRVAHIASIPEREESLKRTIESLYDQVDHIYLSLNKYKKNNFEDRKISAIRLDNSMQDCAKFLDIEFRHGYIFTCDDDIVYPASYCADMIDAIDRYKCVVTLHGKNFKKPFQSFLHIQDNYRCLGNVLNNAYVECGGTGVMAWHADLLKIKYEDFKEPGMADIWMAKVCQEQAVKIMVLAHTDGYLKHTRFHKSIFTTELKKGFERQNAILKQMYA